MDYASTKNDRGSSTTKIMTCSINACLLFVIDWFCGMQIIYADAPYCLDVSEKTYSQGKSISVQLTEYYSSRFAAVGQQVHLDCPTCRQPFDSTVDWWYRQEFKHFNKTVLITNGDRKRIVGENVYHVANDNVSLIVDNIQFDDAGLYTCVCKGGFGNRTTTHLRVTEYVAVNAKSSVMLDCYSSTSDVEWSYKSSKEAQPKNVYSNSLVYDDFKERFRVPHSSEMNFSLVIESVQFNDSGYYTCHEDSETSSKRHTILLITSVGVVHGLPEISFPCWPSVQTEVNWVVWPLQHFDVLWASKTIYKGGRIYENFRERFFLGPSNGSFNNYTLTIKQVQTRDTGVYACVERRGIGDSHYIQLVVTNKTGGINDENLMAPRDSESNTNSSNQLTGTEHYCADTERTVYALSVILVILGLIALIACIYVIIMRRHSRKVRTQELERMNPGS